MADTHGTSALKRREGYFTYAEYKTWPEGERWELIDGIAYDMSPSPRRIHQEFSVLLTTSIVEALKGKPCKVLTAPMDVFWTDDLGQDLDQVDTVTQPDILVVCDPAKLIDQGVKGAPNLVIEILSASTAWKDQNEKRLLHEKFKVNEYLIVNPESYEVLAYRYDQAKAGYGLPAVADLRQGIELRTIAGLSLQVEELS